MPTYRLTTHVKAPRERVFELWIDLDRAPEWIGGLTKITDRTGPLDQKGARYTAWFGSMRSARGARAVVGGRGAAAK